MKKILVLLSMIALASGAWAAETYTWSVAIDEIPAGYTVPSDLTALLIDKNTLQVYAWATYEELTYDTATGTYSWKSSITGEQKHGLLPPTIPEEYAKQLGMENVSHAPSVINFTYGDQRGNFSMSFRTDVDLYTKYWKEAYEGNSYGGQVADLETVVYATVGGNVSYQVLGVGYSSKVSLGSSTAYNPVPEPTSGLLLLLGVAGLALKRKKAA